MNRKRFAWLLALLLPMAIAGCKKDPPPIVPVSGVLLLNGQPLPKAEIRFYPIEEGLNADYIAMAVTDDQGRFTLETNGQPGACACVHKVTVTEGPPPKDARGESARAQKAYSDYARTLRNRPIPSDYGTLATSTLEMTVTAEQSEYKIDLTR